MRVDQPERLLGGADIDREVQRRPQIGGLGVQAFEPDPLVMPPYGSARSANAV
ncbi:hypothetical protein HD597_000147 [Nonomuraea thailandensis]|uniref:Uncharacterized protein n=1 Tax=Nonomuraea thailandensis TaxID=1188745 RepID=A0A9X2G8S7_9ACTN|nr:hypothetical protein [Nonomuraea thailandensis]MCP2353127.1 hypothetical protein [Nonomuraea thailandensis]